ncbi:DUF4344 domain-containing metallopeptidase [Mycolicibacterium vinylchloridicum]|uniref:DUF4344 domain-containing metallopeptidase n=1 Tax=Mycolicibacterium vinylchloridicum TaxID=2736928 RepID=UPI0015C9F5AC|nr:DUF4344 domain-containing metallopeptidase [Mycolicibacterium vinylchloridicum]
MRGRICSIGVVLLSMAVAAGCGHDSSNSSDAPVAASTAQVPQGSGQPDKNANGTPDTSNDDKDWPGKMTASYQDATSPEAVTGRDIMRSEHLLEDLADGITDSLKLPYDIPLIGKQCDTANAYWSPDDKSITICYEDAADALDIYTKAGDDNPRASAVNSEIATFYHETGHMVIDLYDLPATGKEEDVADQLAAYILLAPGPDGKIDPESVQAVKDFAREFKGYSDQKGGEIDEGQLSDVHSLDLARMYNLECWVYGADPVGNADLVKNGSLPEDRADGCEDEYNKLSSSWDTLLGPYLK